MSYELLRWVTRGKETRFALIHDRSGGLRWAEFRGQELVETSSGCFYDNMQPCEPTWRKHHPDARVEAVRAIRRLLSKRRALLAEFGLR